MSRFGQGLAISTGLHVVLIGLVIFVIAWHPVVHLSESNPAFAHAIAVTLAPPHPQPEIQPVPQITPQTLQPIAAPPAIATQAIHSELSTPPPVTKPPTVSPPQQTAQQEASYAQIVSAILQQHKRYPRAAILAGHEGVVVLSFILNREGTVLAYSIVYSSGRPVFDNEVKRLIRSVQFPPFPASDADERKRFQVSIEFRLQG
ncbi:MAG: TonB family protein [Gammaproteobacteria bacterium]